MKTIDRYIIKEMIGPFFGGLGMIIFVLLLNYLLRILSRIIEKKVPVLFVLKLFTLNLAWVFALAVPMACLIAALIAFGRLAQDREIIALQGAGVSLVRIMLPAFLFGLLTSAAMFWFGDAVLPEANHRAKILFSDIRKKKPLAVIKPRLFITDIPGINLWVQDIDYKHNTMKGITIYRVERGEKIPKIITAPRGEMSYDPSDDAVVFTLYNGEVHSSDPKDPNRYTRAYFGRQVIRISDLGTKIKESRSSGGRSDREMTIAMMKKQVVSLYERKIKAQQKIIGYVNDAVKHIFQPDSVPFRANINGSPSRRAYRIESKRYAYILNQTQAIKSIERNIRMYKVEIHKKYTLPLACLLFVFVGVPVGIWTKRGGIGTAIGFGLLFFLVYWVFLIGGEELADRGFLAPWLAMWSADIVLLVMGTFALYRTMYHSS